MSGTDGRPTHNGGGERYHLDLYVDDLDRAEAARLDAGAARPDFQPGERWRVLNRPGRRSVSARDRKS